MNALFADSLTSNPLLHSSLAFLDPPLNEPLPTRPICITRPLLKMQSAAGAGGGPPGSSGMGIGAGTGGDGRRRSPTSRRRGSASSRAKFQCHLCSSTFSRKDNLKTHQRLHSGEMPFQCKYCGRKFRWQSSARTHEQVHERHGHSPRPELAAAAEAASARRASAKGTRSPPSCSPPPPGAAAVKVENVVAVLPPFPTTSHPMHPVPPNDPASYMHPHHHQPVPPPPPPPLTYPATSLPALTAALPTLAHEHNPYSLNAVPPPPRLFGGYNAAPPGMPSGPPPGMPNAAPPGIPNAPPPGVLTSTPSMAPTTPGTPGTPLPPPMQRAISLGSIERTAPPPLTRVLSAPHAYTAVGGSSSRGGRPAQRGRGGGVRGGTDRAIRKPRAAQGLVLELEVGDVMGDVGAALQTTVETATTPNQVAGESPMFGMPELSNHDIELCLDRMPPRKDDANQQ